MQTNHHGDKTYILTLLSLVVEVVGVFSSEIVEAAIISRRLCAYLSESWRFRFGTADPHIDALQTSK